MEISKIYEYADAIGVLVFSTIHGEEVHSRAAHFNGFDEEGIYFRTAAGKPYGRQLMETGRVTVCGNRESEVKHDENGMPVFSPGYSFRLIGEVRNVPAEVIRKKAKTNEGLKVAAYDSDTYPDMADGNFVIHKAKVEIFDYDFAGKSRDHKLLRTRSAFGGATFNPAGPKITDACIECGACRDACTFKAIEEGTPYRVIPERCDDCGSCRRVCPVDAIELSETF